MTKTYRITFLILLVVACAFGQQNTLVQTSLSSAITANQQCFAVASATGITAAAPGVPGSDLYIVDIGQTKGELVRNISSVTSTTVCGRRGNGNSAQPHASGAMVLVATNPSWFQTVDPSGSCTTANTYVTPWLNTVNGYQWLCSAKTGTWVAGWGNPVGSQQVISGTATASVAGATAIAAPLLEISGTNAITSFTMGIGWNGQGFCTYPTGAFTITATNNIAKAATAVADRALCFTYNANSSKFSPLY